MNHALHITSSIYIRIIIHNLKKKDDVGCHGFATAPTRRPCPPGNQHTIGFRQPRPRRRLSRFWRDLSRGAPPPVDDGIPWMWLISDLELGISLIQPPPCSLPNPPQPSSRTARMGTHRSAPTANMRCSSLPSRCRSRACSSTAPSTPANPFEFQATYSNHANSLSSPASPTHQFHVQTSESPSRQTAWSWRHNLLASTFTTPINMNGRGHYLWLLYTI